MRLGKFAFVVLLLVGLFLPASSRVEAQVNTVNLSGTVFDPQQLIVKDAKITLRNAANGAEREAISDSNGRYEIIGIPPGTYSLTVEAPGFAALKDESSEARARHDSRIQPPFAAQNDERNHQCGGCARSRGNNKD